MSRTCNRFGWPSPTPCDAPSLSAALEARHAGLIEPVLVGPRVRLEAVATEAGLDLADVAIVDVTAQPRRRAASRRLGGHR
jgi:phosphotransacetylase